MFISFQGEFHAIIKNGGRVCLSEWEGGAEEGLKMVVRMDCTGEE